MNKNNNIIIAIDGPAASGKGTIAKKLAAKLGFSHLDTGKLYRAVGYKTAQILPNFDNLPANTPALVQQAIEIAKNLSHEDTNNPNLETEEVGRYASVVSAIPEVRTGLLAFQQNFAKNPPNNSNGAVLDGRDIGTVIAPDADFKFFITANAEIRANRRFLQLQSTGKTVTEAAILQDILARDKRDMERTSAPLKTAEDAIVIDTSNASIEEVFERCFNLINKANS